jgi:hypothetical protein
MPLSTWTACPGAIRAFYRETRRTLAVDDFEPPPGVQATQSDPHATSEPSEGQLQATCKPGAWEVPSCTALVYLLFCSYSPLVLLWVPPPCGGRSTEQPPSFDSPDGRVIQRKSRLNRGAGGSGGRVRAMRIEAGRTITNENGYIQPYLSQLLLAWKS